MERHALLRPEPRDEGEPLLEAGRALLPGNSQRLELRVTVPLGDAEDQPPARQGVQRREVLGDLDRVLERQDVDRGADRHVTRVGGDARQHRQRLEGLELDQVVMHHPHRVEAEVPGQAHLLQHLPRAKRGRRVAQVLPGQDEPELHRIPRSRPVATASTAPDTGSITTP